MNVFYLDEKPQVAASMHCDKHVVKMVLECAQLLSSAHHVYESDVKDQVYKKTHVNHPSSVWVREDKSHYDWVYQLMLELGEEYTRRYKKTHLTITKMSELLSKAPNGTPDKGWQDPPQCMPEDCVRDSAKLGYLVYYNHKADEWAAKGKPMTWYGETTE